MLDLIARIGAEFGISVVVASHLLGEIEQTSVSGSGTSAGAQLGARLRGAQR